MTLAEEEAEVQLVRLSLTAGSVKANYFCIVSHHFMSARRNDYGRFVRTGKPAVVP